MNINSLLSKVLLLFLLIAGLILAKNFLIPLTIGGVLATLFLPLGRWLENKKIPRLLATFTCLLIAIIGIFGLGSVIWKLVAKLLADFPILKLKFEDFILKIQSFMFSTFGISKEDQYSFLLDQNFDITGIISSLSGSFLGVITDLLFILVYLFLLLYYRTHLKNFILKFTEKSKKQETEKLIYNVSKVSQQYLVGLTKMIVLLWIMYSIGFGILGVKNAIFFAILCGVLEIVPYVGNLTGTFLTLLFSAAHGGSLPMLAGIIVVYGVIQFIQGWVLETLIVGPQVKINPLFTIISLVLGELIWGIPGVFLAIPLIAMAKIICQHIDPLKPYAFLIGEVESTKSEIN